MKAMALGGSVLLVAVLVPLGLLAPSEAPTVAMPTGAGDGSATAGPYLAASDAPGAGELCDAGQNDAGRPGDAGDSPMETGPPLQITDRDQQPGVEYGGWVYPIINVPGLDNADNYALVPPPHFLDTIGGPGWELRLEVETLPLTQLFIMIGFMREGLFVVVHETTTEPTGGTTVIEDVQVPPSVPMVVASFNSAALVGAPPPLSCPGAAGPLHTGGHGGALTRPGAVGGTASADLLGVLADYKFKPEGCKPQCAS